MIASVNRESYIKEINTKTIENNECQCDQGKLCKRNKHKNNSR